MAVYIHDVFFKPLTKHFNWVLKSSLMPRTSKSAANFQTVCTLA